MKFSSKMQENKTIEVKLDNENFFSLVVRPLTYPELVRISHLNLHNDESYLDKCLDFVVGWEGVIDEEEKPVTFTRENLESFLAQNGGMVYATIGALSKYVHSIGRVDEKK